MKETILISEANRLAHKIAQSYIKEVEIKDEVITEYKDTMSKIKEIENMANLEVTKEHLEAMSFNTLSLCYFLEHSNISESKVYFNYLDRHFFINLDTKKLWYANESESIKLDESLIDKIYKYK
jgi:hypothetical protein